jgi:iron complex outermembrane recepter protein
MICNRRSVSMRHEGVCMRVVFRVSVSLSALLPAAMAAAQTAAPPASPSGNEIVVTAQKRSEKLQNVPIAVSAFSALQLERSGVGDLVQLTKVTPSLMITEGTGPAQPYIRGVGGRYNTPGNEPSTSLYIDGVYQTDKTGMLVQGFPDVQSVQVLRGPQGTLFGRNATAGAILITTKHPDQQFGAMAEGTMGTDERAGRAFVTGGLTHDLAISASGFYTDDIPYIRNGNPANGAGRYVGADKDGGARVELQWKPSSTFSATLSGYYSNGQADAVVALQPIAGSPTTVGEVAAQRLGVDIRDPQYAYYGSVDPKNTSKGYGTSLVINADLDAVSIKSISAYSHSTAYELYDLAATPAPVFIFQNQVKDRTWQQELDLTSRTDGRFQWIAGAFYLNYRDGFAHLDEYVGLAVPSSQPEGVVPASLYAASAAGKGATSGLAYIDQHDFVTIQSLGLFVEPSYRITDAAKLTLGLRYTADWQDLDSGNAVTTYVPNGTGGVIASQATALAACAANAACTGLHTPFSKLTYRAVFDYKVSPALMAYASYNRGFKSGVYNMSSVANVIATRPETLDAFELGFKSRLFGRKVTLNADAYYYNYTNMQVTTVTPATNLQQSINAAKATISGLEAEAGYNPTRRLSFSAGFSTFLTAKYDSFKDCVIYRPTGAGLAVAVNADCSGTNLPSTPRVQANLQANYTLPLDDGAHIDLNGLFSYTGSFNQNTYGYYPAGATYGAGEGSAPWQRPIHTLNMGITFHAPGDAFYASVWGRNLLNQTDVYRNVSATTFGYYGVLARGITGGVTIGKKLGSQRN